jgi:hypothetical protein
MLNVEFRMLNVELKVARAMAWGFNSTFNIRHSPFNIASPRFADSAMAG